MPRLMTRSYQMRQKRRGAAVAKSQEGAPPPTPSTTAGARSPEETADMLERAAAANAPTVPRPELQKPKPATKPSQTPKKVEPAKKMVHKSPFAARTKHKPTPPTKAKK